MVHSRFKTLLLFAWLVMLLGCGGKESTVELKKTDSLSIFMLRKSALKTDTIPLKGFLRDSTEKCVFLRLKYKERGIPVIITFMKTCPEDTMNRYLVECMTEKYGVIQKNDVRNKTLYLLRTNNDSINQELSRLLTFITQNPI